MKDMAAMAKHDTTNKNFKNHSIRKTIACKLQKAGISNNKIAAISGHKNEQSLRAFMNRKTHISAEKPLRQLNAKVCDHKIAFLLLSLFRPLCQTIINQKRLN